MNNPPTQAELDHARKERQKEAGAIASRVLFIVALFVVLGVISPVIVGLGTYYVCPGDERARWAIGFFVGFIQMIATFIVLGFGAVEIMAAGKQDIKKNDSEVDEPLWR